MDIFFYLYSIRLFRYRDNQLILTNNLTVIHLPGITGVLKILHYNLSVLFTLFVFQLQK